MTSDDNLKARGTELFAALSPEGTDATRKALSLEAARTADRLDELDNIIAGKGVLKLMRFRVADIFDDAEGKRNIRVEVKFDSVLGEARQQANVLRQMLVSLGLGTAAAAKPVAKKESKKDELAQRRNARRSRA